MRVRSTQDAITEIIGNISQGNIGCATMLMEAIKVMNGMEWGYFADVLNNKNLKADRAYMLWNDACGRDIKKTYELVRKIDKGIIPMEKVEEHLAAGRCAPFTVYDEVDTMKKAEQAKARFLPVSSPERRRISAKCPSFTSRVDYYGCYYISCTNINLRFDSREKRDEAYWAACCENPEQCPLKRVSAEQMQEAAQNKPLDGKIIVNIR